MWPHPDSFQWAKLESTGLKKAVELLKVETAAQMVSKNLETQLLRKQIKYTLLDGMNLLKFRRQNGKKFKAICIPALICKHAVRNLSQIRSMGYTVHGKVIP